MRGDRRRHLARRRPAQRRRWRRRRAGARRRRGRRGLGLTAGAVRRWRRRRSGRRSVESVRIERARHRSSHADCAFGRRMLDDAAAAQAAATVEPVAHAIGGRARVGDHVGHADAAVGAAGEEEAGRVARAARRCAATRARWPTFVLRAGVDPAIARARTRRRRRGRAAARDPRACAPRAHRRRASSDVGVEGAAGEGAQHHRIVRGAPGPLGRDPRDGEQPRRGSPRGTMKPMPVHGCATPVATVASVIVALETRAQLAAGRGQDRRRTARSAAPRRAPARPGPRRAAPTSVAVDAIDAPRACRGAIQDTGSRVRTAAAGSARASAAGKAAHAAAQAAEGAIGDRARWRAPRAPRGRCRRRRRRRRAVERARAATGGRRRRRGCRRAAAARCAA